MASDTDLDLDPEPDLESAGLFDLDLERDETERETDLETDRDRERDLIWEEEGLVRIKKVCATLPALQHSLVATSCSQILEDVAICHKRTRFFPFYYEHVFPTLIHDQISNQTFALRCLNAQLHAHVRHPDKQMRHAVE